MQRLRWLALALVSVAITAASASAQTSSTRIVSNTDTEPKIRLPSSGDVTPEMWFYMQEYQRYQQPKEAVRRKAEIRAAQRQNRLEAQRWFGFSNQRPVANPIPYYSTYSPAWVGNSWNPFSWSGSGQPFVTYHTAKRDQ